MRHDRARLAGFPEIPHKVNLAVCTRPWMNGATRALVAKAGLESALPLVPEPQFADPFPRADEAQWRALVARVLKGAPFETLMSRTADGIEIAPLYQSRKHERPRALRARPGNWAIAARVDHPDPREANRLALADLEGGADALQLVFADASGAHGFGLPPRQDALEAVLEGVALEAGVRFELDMSAASTGCAEALAAMFEARSIDPANACIHFGLDPLGQIARHGGGNAAWSELARAMTSTANNLAARGFAGRFCTADGRLVHASGGSEALELAFVLACALAYWRALEAAGVDIDSARGMISFRMAADADQFLTIAKFRALRRLWARIEEASGLQPMSIDIHAESAWRMMTRVDPAVNFLRATIACFSAGLGGADVVSLLPYTQAIGLPDLLARRIARNTQLVLLEEAGLGRVADPVAGAGVFEAMTEALCEKAWTLMQEIESAGGMFAALDTGWFQTRIMAARAARQKLIATRQAPLTGASWYPQLDEAAIDVLQSAPLVQPTRGNALAPTRDAAIFEVLRARSDAILLSKGQRPQVFLANLDNLAGFAERAGFAKNLFEAGGIEAIPNDGFADNSALESAFRASGASLACLCSSDDVYARRAASAAQALKNAGARKVCLAGRPGAQEVFWRAAGISDFVYADCDVIATLESAYANL